jgi:hypothetical protein
MWSLTLPRTKRIVASLDRRFIELSPLRRGVECPALTRYLSCVHFVNEI